MDRGLGGENQGDMTLSRPVPKDRPAGDQPVAAVRRRTAAGVELELRRLTYSDLPQVIATERRAFPTPWSLAMFVLELSKPSGICLAATIDGQVVGYLVCSRYDAVWHLMNVAVDERHRRRGIATALIERLLKLADRPNGQYTLEVRTSNGSAITLYERFGFRAAGRRRGYYHDNREDALIMWRTVPADAASAPSEE
jgi:[ribosomal protein S18]-alanine N-acetyltransferase